MAWNGSGGTDTPKVEAVKKSPSMGKGLLAGAIVVVLAVLVRFLFFAPAPALTDEADKAISRQIAEKSPALTHKADLIPETKSLKYPQISNKRIEKREGVPELKTLNEMQEELVKNTRPRPIFTNAAEELITLVTPSQPGSIVPPLPALTDAALEKDVATALKNAIKAEDGDSVEVLEKKMVVVAAKAEFEELRHEGMGFVEYLNALRDQANADADFLSEVHKIADEIYHDEAISDDEYLVYRDQLNEKLNERGLPLLDKEGEPDTDANE